MDPFDLFTYGVIIILLSYFVYIIVKLGKHLRRRNKANDPIAAAYAKIILDPDGPSRATQAMLDSVRQSLNKK